MKIGAKLITSFLLMGLLIGVVGLIAVATSRDNLQKSIGDSSEALARELLNDIDSSLHERLMDISLLAGSHVPKHFLVEINETGESPSHPVGGVGEDLVSLSSDAFISWEDIFIVGLDSIIEASSDESLVGQSLLSFDDTGLEQALAGKTFISDAFLSPLDGGKIMMVFAAPVRNHGLSQLTEGDTSVEGAVIGYLNFGSIVGIMKKAEVYGQEEYKTIHLKLTNKKGEVLYSTEDFNFLDSASPEIIYGLDEVIGREGDFSGVYYWLGDGSVDQEETLVSYASSRGHEDYGGFGWLSFVEYETKEIFAPVDQLKNIILGISLVAIFMAIFIGFFISQSILNSIQKLSLAAQKVSRGDLSVKADIETKDEIGHLAQLFNGMTSSLREARKDIEEKVQEQTESIGNQKKKLENQQKAILNILQDVEEEKNKTIRERDKIDAILHSIGDGVFVVDQEYKITMINKVASDISGFSGGDVVGKRYDSSFKFIYEKTGKINEAFIRAAMVTGNIQTMTGRTLLIRKDGSRVPVADSAAPIKNKEGKIVGCIVVFRDSTQEREIDKMKTEFVSIASHQLRTPLTAIKLFIEMLMGQNIGKLNEKQLDYTENVRRSTERMIRLVNDLLNVSRLETGKLKIKPEPTQLEGFIEETISELVIMARARNYSIIFNKPEEQTPKVSVDKALLHQVVHNLISNAIRYSTKKKSKIIVTLKEEKSMKTQKLDTIISVKDDGIGISKSVQSRIFEKFFRSDAAQKAEAEGSGLGLYVAKLIMEAGGGKIWFESEEGTGTTFYVRIPSGGMVAKEGVRDLA